jgi:hypothetical protein
MYLKKNYYKSSKNKFENKINRYIIQSIGYFHR